MSLIRGCCMVHPVHMSVRIQEYGMVGASPFRGAQIPLEVMGNYASGVRDLMSGAADAVAGVMDLSNEMERVRAAGTRSAIEDGVKKFRSEVMRELEQSGSPDTWEEKWKYAVDNRLGAYLPASIPGVNGEDLNEYVRQVKEEGASEARRMAQLANIAEARELWERRMVRAGDAGSDTEIERGMDEGRGIFISERDADAYLQKAKERASLARARREADNSPLAMGRGLKDGAHPISENESAATGLLSRIEKNLDGVKGKYGAWMLDIAAKGGFVEESSIENAAREGLISSEQARKYRDFVMKEKEAVWTRRQPEALPAERCEWRRRIDERGESDDASLMIDLACSGLPRSEILILSDRLKKTSLISPDIRKKYSSAVTGLYSGGVWGAAGDSRTLKEWSCFQDKVMGLLADSPEGELKAAEVIEEERRKLLSSWVTYGEMNEEK